MSSVLVLFLQIAAILTMTMVCGSLVKRIGQPQVVGEIAGGLLLGPLALGHFFPAFFNFLFAASRLLPLDILSNVGLVLFLFLMGAELNLRDLRGRQGTALSITAGSIGVPFAMGSGLAWFLFGQWGEGHADQLSFVLFVGIATSITAMPVLARILQDRKEAGRALEPMVGTMAMLCAAANDLLGWCLLAFTLALHHHNGSGGTEMHPAMHLLLVPVYLAGMVFVVRPLVNKLFALRAGLPAWVWLPALIALAFGSARLTELLEVHAFFGAFVAGACVSRALQSEVVEGRSAQQRLHQFLQPVIRLALPVFFAMTGLRMRREIFSAAGVSLLGIILLVAVTGKIGGGMLGAWACRMSWRSALQIGILMNTRGLVELIVLNIGYKEGILSPALFTLFVLMAVITTVMTSPIIDLSYKLAVVKEG